MSLKLPSFPDIRRTLSAWAVELRGSGVVAVGRGRGPAIPYFAEGGKDWEQRSPADIGEGWIDYSPSIGVQTRTITLHGRGRCRYQILANTLYSTVTFEFTLGGLGGATYGYFSLPFDLPEWPVVSGMSDGAYIVGSGCFREALGVPFPISVLSSQYGGKLVYFNRGDGSTFTPGLKYQISAKVIAEV